MTKDEVLARIALEYDSLIPVDIACAAGLTIDDLTYRCEIGRLERMRRGVLRVAGTPETWEQHLLAACIAAGALVAASHRSAAFVRGFKNVRRPTRLEITAPSPLHPRLPGVRAYRVPALDADDVSIVRGIPVTSTARTIVDLASVMSPKALDAIVNDLFRRQLVTVRALAAAADRAEAGGLRRRLTVVRRIVEAKGDGFHPGDSDPEVWVVETLMKAGLGRPLQQFRVRVRGRDYRIDAAYPEYKVGVEYEGEEGHALPGDLQRDRRRHNELTTAGWDIRYATKTTTSRELVDDVRAALRRAGARA